jgi:hypothetical protein
MSNKVKVNKKPAKRRSVSPDRSAQLGKRVAAGIGVIVVLAIVGVVAFSPEPLDGVPDGTETVEVGAPQHVEGDIHDENEVPAGGEHNPRWLNCGYYPERVEAEFAVHSLEHGAVWITYSPSIGDTAVEQLRRHVGRLEKVIVSPVDELDSPILLTAWGQQLGVDEADDERIEQFVNEFAGSPDAPEPGGACTGGVGSPVL